MHSAYLTEVTRVVLVEVDTVMVLTTSQTATSRVLPVLANATVSGGHVAALLAVCPEPCAQNDLAQASFLQ